MKSKLARRVPRLIHTENPTGLPGNFPFHTGTYRAIPGRMAVVHASPLLLSCKSWFSNLINTAHSRRTIVEKVYSSAVYIYSSRYPSGYLYLTPPLILSSLCQPPSHVPFSRRFGYRPSYMLPNSFDPSQPKSIKRQISHSAVVHPPNRPTNIQGTLNPTSSPPSSSHSTLYRYSNL